MPLHPFGQQNNGAAIAAVQAVADRQQRTDSLPVPQQLGNFVIGQGLDAFRGFNSLGPQLSATIGNRLQQNVENKQFTDSLNQQLQLQRLQNEGRVDAIGALGGLLGGGLGGGGIPSFQSLGPNGEVINSVGPGPQGGQSQSSITPFGGFDTEIANATNAFGNLANSELPPTVGGLPGGPNQEVQRQFGDTVSALAGNQQTATDRFGAQQTTDQQFASDRAGAASGLKSGNLFEILRRGQTLNDVSRRGFGLNLAQRFV